MYESTLSISIRCDINASIIIDRYSSFYSPKPNHLKPEALILQALLYRPKQEPNTIKTKYIKKAKNPKSQPKDPQQPKAPNPH
jgi:hypothetical protein